jgi:type I restriction enzyme M protein
MLAISPGVSNQKSRYNPQILPGLTRQDAISVEQGLLMAAAKNERNTENIVRDELRVLGYYRPSNRISVEEQKSQIEAVRRLMKAASKSGQGGGGSPEFIISAASAPDFVLIIECKSSTRDHISTTCQELLDGKAIDEDDETAGKRIQRYAVDGALHYARHLSKEFNVITVAVCGETKDSSVISTHLHAKSSPQPKVLTTKDGQAISKIIPWHDYIEHATFDPAVQRLRADELMAFSRELHEFMRDHAKLTESEKPLLVSGTLIALRNKAFAKAFDEYTPEELQNEWLEVITKEVRKAEIPQAKKDKMVQPYSTIAAHPELGKATKQYPKGVLHELINRLNEKVWPFISVYHDFDVVGQFYGEFLRYTGGDKKALGIVLTPRHITELFSLLANVNKSSRVLDICAGTGGFLVSAMHQMMKNAITEKEKARIRETGLVGVEPQPNMFALAASNMILRGDGKANLYQGSCFEDSIISAVKGHNCNVGMLNPPFSQSDEQQHELNFIKQMLDCLKKGSVGISLAPIGCVVAPHQIRHDLLKQHTLEAVMTLPDDLFHPVGTIPCIMVFTAKIPHAVSSRKTWFGYWKKDGFVKTKNLGRVDLYGKWPDIRKRWIESFRNREIVSGLSVARHVTADDEWCAEAYMETDYSTLTQQDFERELKKYVVFKIMNAQVLEGATSDEEVT